jgi:hypothetical protein
VFSAGSLKTKPSFNFPRPLLLPGLEPGLPDGIFSNPKSQFG